MWKRLKILPTIVIHGKLKFLLITIFFTLIILVILVTNMRSDCSIHRALNHHLSEKPADHDGVEADDEEEGQEVAKDEEAHLQMQRR